MQHGVPLREGSSLAVLPGHPNRVTGGKQGCKRCRFGTGPVQWSFSFGHFAALRHRTLEFFVGRELGWQSCQRIKQTGQLLCVTCCVSDFRWFQSTEICTPVGGKCLCIGNEWFVLASRELGFQFLGPFLLDLLSLFRADLSQIVQPCQILFSYRGPAVNFGVHAWLGESRLVTLVVSPTPEGVQIDHNIPMELLAKIHRQRNDLRDRFGVFAVDVKDRNLQHFGDVGRIGRAAALVRFGRESDLIVDDDVECAAGSVTLQFAQVQGFLDDSFPGEGGIAMDQDRHHFLAA